MAQSLSPRWGDNWKVNSMPVGRAAVYLIWFALRKFSQTKNCARAEYTIGLDASAANYLSGRPSETRFLR